MSDFKNPNTNEYHVCELTPSGAPIEYDIMAIKYEFNPRTKIATFWYWRKNLWLRWELVSFERKLEWVYQVIDATATAPSGSGKAQP